MKAASDIDESLYSRQLYVMGHEAQRKLSQSAVLLIGLNGLGVEVAKNIILMGVKSVTLYDETMTSYSDLSSQFYLSEQDIGKNRAVCSVSKLMELNPYVNVSSLQSANGINDLSVFDQFTVVVLTDLPLSRRNLIADYCHSRGIYVVCAVVRGVFGSIFCDFGEQFVVHDINGEPVSTSMVSNITLDTKGLVTVLEDTRHNLETGDKIVITDIVGMTELNGIECIVEVKDPFSFLIDLDTMAFTPYIRGGYIQQIKKPTTISFKCMSDSFSDPGEFVGDFVKFMKMLPLHLAFVAVEKFMEKYNRLPTAGSVSDAQEVYELTCSLNSSFPESSSIKISSSDLSDNELFIKRLSMCCQGNLSPICAILGGVVGQEVLKACSGKFMPIKQWFYYDAVEALPEEPVPESEVAPMNCRYDGQIMVFGRTMQEKLSNLNMFLVGAGAIGCEMIKNWAMMGVASEFQSSSSSSIASTSGMIYVTDMDQIEKSNLSRQFLFRNTDINCPKSTTAVRAARVMNPGMNAIAYENKVAPETEGLFNDDFYEKLDAICTALDNVEARLYLDQKCMFYRKPMLESGTLGAKGHTQVVVPFQTENYGATRDPPEKSIPVCTLKHFPNQIDHTLQWAREWFEENFKQTPEDCNKYLHESNFFESLAHQQNMKLDVLRKIKQFLLIDRPSDLADCIRWARLIFEELYSNSIKQLLHNFPLDRITSTGTPFWSGAKKPPTPIQFELQDALHYEFIVACTAMRATAYGIDVPSDFDSSNHTKSFVAQVISTVVVPPFKPADGVKIAATDEEAKAESAQPVHLDIDQECDLLIKSLPAPSTLPGFRMKVVDFDKDIDAHMRVVAAVSNLRARNYQIPEADLHKSRGIAGKITPAIATTTALVTGAICIELFKIIQKKETKYLMNSFNNLAIPLFTTMEPEPPKSTISILKKNKEWKWNQWDRIDIFQPDLTLKGLMAWLEDEYGLSLTMLSTGVTILYSDFMPRKKMEERKVMKMKEVVEMMTKKEIPSKQKYLIFELITVHAESGDEVDIPYLCFRLR